MIKILATGKSERQIIAGRVAISYMQILLFSGITIVVVVVALAYDDFVDECKRMASEPIPLALVSVITSCDKVEVVLIDCTIFAY